MNWHELNEEKRVKDIYSKHSIEDFWNWWSNNQNRVMEVRIKDFDLIKEIANKFNIPFSASGVYVKNAEELKRVIAYARDKAVMWFGLQPRKKNWNKFGKKSFGGSDNHVGEIAYLFIDIDRIIKNGGATNNELKACDELCNKILERLSTQGWNKSYCKICSSHGLQLLIKLDYPIKLPEIEFDNKNKIFLPNEEFDKIKQIIREGLGGQISRFGKKFREELQVEIDKSCFKISNVGALHCTKNFKYDMTRWRGIVELKDGENTGLTDYILSKENDIKIYKNKNVFIKSRTLDLKHRLTLDKLHENILIRFLLDNDLPYGEINNKLWFQFKCLLRDNKIDLSSKEFILLHKELEAKFKGDFTINLPDPKFTFDENIVNSYCINNCLPPLYKLWPNRTKKLDMKLDNIDWNIIEFVDEEMELKSDTTIQEDLKECKTLLKEGLYDNKFIVGKFLKGCIKKYGEAKTMYYFKYLIERYF